jgi:hypothetical protein
VYRVDNKELLEINEDTVSAKETLMMAIWAGSLLHQAMPVGVGGGLGPVGRACFGEDVADVAGDGVQTDDQFCCNLRVAPTGSNETQHLHFSLGQTIWINGGRTCLHCHLLLQSLYPFHQGNHAQIMSDD